MVTDVKTAFEWVPQKLAVNGQMKQAGALAFVKSFLQGGFSTFRAAPP